MRSKRAYSLTDLEGFKDRLLAWAAEFEQVLWLDSNAHNLNYNSYDLIVAVDALTSLTTDYTSAFEQLKEYQQTTKDWLFGYLSYDLKNDVEALSSDNIDGLDFPELYFFQPKKIITLKGSEVAI